MSDGTRKRRWLPRFSLINALLLMTIVGLGVGLWQNSQKLLPLQREIIRLRKEMGALKFSDPTRVYVRNDETAAPLLWRRRVYVPPGKRYVLRCVNGELPYREHTSLQQWLRSSNGRTNRLVDRLTIDEETTIEIGLTPLDHNNRVKVILSDGTAEDRWVFAKNNWLADDRIRLRKDEQAYDYGTVHEYASDESIVLLHLERGKLIERGENWHTEATVEPTEHLIVWIEPVNPPAPPAATTATATLAPAQASPE